MRLSYAVYYPMRQLIVIVPKTSLGEMEKMVDQGKWVPWGLLWDGEVPAGSSVVMDSVEARWKRALAEEIKRIGKTRGGANTAGAT